MEYFGFDDNKSNSPFMNRNRNVSVGYCCPLLCIRSIIFVPQIIHFDVECRCCVMLQLLFLLGLYFFIGVTGIVKFFTKKGKIQGSCVYFGGLLVVVFGWTFVGVVCQVVGFFIIFRSFLPDFYDYVCRTPFIGHYLSTYL